MQITRRKLIQSTAAAVAAAAIPIPVQAEQTMTAFVSAGGMVDDFRIYNRALSHSEIQLHVKTFFEFAEADEWRFVHRTRPRPDIAAD